jgi:hypothetical protein
MTNGRQPARAVLLVNAHDNRQAQFDRDGFSDAWTWIETPQGWTPEQPVNCDLSTLNAVIVFSPTYRERETRSLCEAIRQRPEFAEVPLLAGINMYQMPLGNAVKKLANAHFVFTPLKEEELVSRLNEMTA